MVIDAWLPIGYQLPDGTLASTGLSGAAEWQLIRTSTGGFALLAKPELASQWLNAGLLEEGALERVEFGETRLRCVASGPSQTITHLGNARSPADKNDALAFASAMRDTRRIDRESSLADAIYVERYSRILPTYSLTPTVPDEIALGTWLTGGAPIPVTSFRRLHQVVSWLDPQSLAEIIDTAGFHTDHVLVKEGAASTHASPRANAVGAPEAGRDAQHKAFELPGRPALEAFFNEHVVDVIQNADRYSAMGIGFPCPIVLYGPPGTGKTFAVDQLVEFLGWPDYAIDASSVASPYIHETSRKVSEVFGRAMDDAPSVLVIDEMEAFLADRDMASGHHRVEEVAEFLRRIPEATSSNVLVIGMTNRIDLIDAAILRRGRFDHVIEVGFATEAEVYALLRKLLAALPTDDDVDVASLAKSLTQRPLSDIAFVVREAARLAARASRDRVSQQFLADALESTPKRSGNDSIRTIGFR